MSKAHKVSFTDVRIGDKIMAVTNQGDIKTLVVGTVAKRGYESHATYLYSKHGQTIAVLWDDYIAPPIILLLSAAATPEADQLWSDELMEELQQRASAELTIEEVVEGS